MMFGCMPAALSLGLSLTLPAGYANARNLVERRQVRRQVAASWIEGEQFFLQVDFIQDSSKHPVIHQDVPYFVTVGDVDELRDSLRVLADDRVASKFKLSQGGKIIYSDIVSLVADNGEGMLVGIFGEGDSDPPPPNNGIRQGGGNTSLSGNWTIQGNGRPPPSGNETRQGKGHRPLPSNSTREGGGDPPPVVSWIQQGDGDPPLPGTSTSR
ncbi:MAG: hypothetical protein M1832_001997 [Thelocarpon impressellum]|nr:MAG: hypothetical protein M1832_001997 [Thelocarpon impressellum]